MVISALCVAADAAEEATLAADPVASEATLEADAEAEDIADSVDAAEVIVMVPVIVAVAEPDAVEAAPAALPVHPAAVGRVVTP